MQRLNRGRAHTSGFTLVELAVVVLVITLLLGGLLVPLATQVEQRNVSETQKRLQEVKEALIGFAMANGRFPCPAVVNNNPTDSGTEIVASGVPTDGDCFTFPNGKGYVPGITLGLSNLDNQGFVVDAWGLKQNRIRYAITKATVNGVIHAFTKQGGMRAAGIEALGSTPISVPPGVDLLFVCASSAGITPNDCGPIGIVNNKLTSDAVFIVYSLGKNAATGGTSPDEAVNLDGKTVFVNRINSSQTGGEFDDLMLWTSRYNVIGQLTAVGQLP